MVEAFLSPPASMVEDSTTQRRFVSHGFLSSRDPSRLMLAEQLGRNVRFTPKAENVTLVR
jgi:hypothetical protein